MRLSKDIHIDPFHITDLYASGTDDEFEYFRDNADILQEWGVDFVTLRLKGKVRAIGGIIETDRGPFAVMSNNIKHGEIRMWDLPLLFNFCTNYLKNITRRKGIEIIFADIDLTKQEDGRSMTDLWFAYRLKFIPCDILKNVIKPKRTVLQMAWKEKWES